MGGVKSGKSQNEQMMFALPPKADKSAQPLCAISGHWHCSKFAIHYAAALPAAGQAVCGAPLERKS
jgi:hypothetical protein